MWKRKYQIRKRNCEIYGDERKEEGSVPDSLLYVSTGRPLKNVSGREKVLGKGAFNYFKVWERALSRWIIVALRSGSI